MDRERMRWMEWTMGTIAQKEYNQRSYTHECGTPACIAGHTVVQFEGMEELQRLKAEDAAILASGGLYERSAIWGRAQELLGLNEWQAQELFEGYPRWEWLEDGWTFRKPTTRDAVQALRVLRSQEEARDEKPTDDDGYHGDGGMVVGVGAGVNGESGGL